MFNNLGRQIVDSAVTYMSREVLKKKKKDLIRIMEREGDNTPKYLMSAARRTHNVHAFERNASGFAVALDYKSATHYYVASLPEVFAVTHIPSGGILECLNTLGDDFTIETSIQDIDIFVQIINRSKDRRSEGDITINGNAIEYIFRVFLYSKEKPFCLVHYPLFYVYVGEDHKTLFFIANSCNPMSSAFSTVSADFTLDGSTHTIDILDVNDTLSGPITAVFKHITNCITYIHYEIERCKSNKSKEEDVTDTLVDFLNKAINGKLDKPTTKKSERAISVANESRVEVEVEDKLVPLHRYLKEYAPTVKRVSKGGHHASPVPHDRRGYYRKSRGRGDYDLINDEFVFVGDMKGTYSWVSATHVGNKKSKKEQTLIYKV